MVWCGGAWRVLAAAGVCVLLACGGSGDDDDGAAGTGASAAAASGGASGAGASGAGATGGASGTSGSAGSSGTNAGGASGNAGTAGKSGSGGAQSGSGGSAGTTMSPRDGGPDASGGDSGRPDAGPSIAMPLAERVCPKGVMFGSPLPGTSTTATAQPVQGGFVFLEGPVWLAEQGWLLFSDMDMNMGGPNGPPSRIRRLKPPSTFDVFAETGNSNGLALDVDGSVLACTHDMRTLSRFAVATSMRTPLALTYMGKKFNSPNDLTVRSDGTVYFTDPDWQLAGRTNETMMTGVYRITPDDKVELVEGGLNKPNGITLSLDEKTLYVGSASSEIWRYPVNADGSVGSKSVFARPGGSDGLGIDCAGNLYVTGGNSVKIYGPGDSPDKQPVATIMVNGGNTSNVAFGGADRKTLYITAGNTLHSIAVQIPGLPY